MKVLIDSAILYFTPVLSANRYVISYGLNNTADQHSVLFDQKDNSGVISHTIGALNKNTKYYFKVRGLNGCAPGNWSSIISEKTTNSTRVSDIKTQTVPTKVMTFSQINGVETEAKIETGSKNENSIQIKNPEDKEKENLNLSTSTEAKSAWNYQYIAIIFVACCLFLSMFLIFFRTKEKKTKNAKK